MSELNKLIELLTKKTKVPSDEGGECEITALEAIHTGLCDVSGCIAYVDAVKLVLTPIIDFIEKKNIDEIDQEDQTINKTIFKCLLNGELVDGMCPHRNSKNHCGTSKTCDYKEPIDDLKIGRVYLSKFDQSKVTVIKQSLFTQGVMVEFGRDGYSQNWHYSKTEFLAEFKLENIGE